MVRWSFTIPKGPGSSLIAAKLPFRVVFLFSCFLVFCFLFSVFLFSFLCFFLSFSFFLFFLFASPPAIPSLAFPSSLCFLIYSRIP